LVDHFGLIITGIVSAASCTERDGLEVLLNMNQGLIPRKVFADQGYSGADMRERAQLYHVDLETAPRRKDKGFVVEAKRWIVERTFAWLGKFRRLSKDYELITTSSMSMIYLVMIRLMLKRIDQLI
jgi:putative transposase